MSMLLDLSRLQGGGERIDRRIPPDSFETPAEDFRVVEPVQLTVDVRRDGEKVRLVGRVATVLEVPCCRCLEPFRTSVDNAFDLLFLPASEAGAAEGDDDRQLDEAAVNASFYEDEAIDLVEVVREQFYLALPMKPLCREDCRGLCPVCGTNRNEATCSCEQEWVDPRMDALRRLKAGGNH